MKGSLSVELSLLFPIVFLILIILMQCGLYFCYRIYTQCKVQESLILCEEQRKHGLDLNPAMEKAKKYLEESLQGLAIETEFINWNQTSSWMKEEYEVTLQMRYSFVITLSWNVKQKKRWLNPVGFRNRVDFLWEKRQVLWNNAE